MSAKIFLSGVLLFLGIFGFAAAEHVFNPLEWSSILQDGLSDWQFWNDATSGPAYTNQPFAVFDCDINGHTSVMRFSTGETNFDGDGSTNSFIRKEIFLRAGDTLWFWGHHWGGSAWWVTFIQIHDPDIVLVYSGDSTTNQVPAHTASKTGTYTIDWRPNPDIFNNQGRWSGHFWVLYGHAEGPIPDAICITAADCRPHKICPLSSFYFTAQAIDWTSIRVSWANGEQFQSIEIAQSPDFQNFRTEAVVDGRSGTYVIGGLQGSANYSVRVTAYGSGSIITRKPVFVVTPPQPPCKPVCLHEEAKPDLIPRIILPEEGQEINRSKSLMVKAVIENKGGSTAGVSRLQLFIDGQKTRAMSIKPIKPGENRTASLPVTAAKLRGLPSGNHTFELLADAAYRILEKSETNNLAKAHFVIPPGPEIG